MVFRKRKGRSSPLGILIWSAILTAICGAVVFGEPLEDLLRGARASLDLRPADGKVVVVLLDDRSLDTMGLSYSESYDARLIERLISAGANRIYYDRAYLDVHDEPGAKQLTETLKRYPKRVFFGAIRKSDLVHEQDVTILPNRRYWPYAGVTSLLGKATPFGLSAEMHYADRFELGVVPSMSASIAGVTGAPGDTYRPDWRIRVSSIPTLKYLEALEKPLGSTVRGKDVVIGPDSVRIYDTHHIVGQGWVPGVFFHVIGAQTLREGVPTHASWLWAWGAALALSVLVIRARKSWHTWALHGLAAALGLVVPFITDNLLITTDYVPAILLYVVVAYRTHNHVQIRKAKHENADSHLPNLAAFREIEDAGAQPIAALVIKNYNAILNAFPDINALDVVEAVARPIRLTALGTTIHHEDNTLYWKLPELDPGEMQGHVDGLLKLVRSITVGGIVIDVDCALGIDESYDEPLDKRASAAKIAADEAARLGTDRGIYKPASADDARWRLSQMSELDLALERGELSMVYQPQLDLRSGRILSAEALVRWRHPVKGFIPPAEFIVQAEASNRIEAVTDYVMEKVLVELAPVFRIEPEFEISVNLSAKLMTDPSLVARLVETLERHGVRPTNLKLEITETAALEANREVVETIARLAGFGIAISIDDYGTGNATLDYLRSMTFHELKIDRQFVMNVTQSERDRLLVESTIKLAHALGHSVIAEGVETEEALQLLRRLGCDRLQGYHIARPMPIDQLLGAIDAQHAAPETRSKTGLAKG